MKRAHLPAIAVSLTGAALLYAQTQPKRIRSGVLTDQEKALSAEMGKLRSLPDAEWTEAVGQLARETQHLLPSAGKFRLIGGLSGLVTEGDAGRDTLQIVADTMADMLRDSANPTLEVALARLARYEYVQAMVDSPGYRNVMAKFEANDRQRESADFTLADLYDRTWSLKSLRGKVVLVNFWASWCPPCRKEMPDMETLYQRFREKGLVILAISDEVNGKVERFIAEREYSYPILLDTGRQLNQIFAVEGIPNSYLYNREGRLVAQAMDRRTEGSFSRC
jgi:peroxiredoxin